MTSLGPLMRGFRNGSKLRKGTDRLASLKRLGMAGLLVLTAHAIAMIGIEDLDSWTAI